MWRFPALKTNYPSKKYRSESIRIRNQSKLNGHAKFFVDLKHDFEAVELKVRQCHMCVRCSVHLQLMKFGNSKLLDTDWSICLFTM